MHTVSVVKFAQNLQLQPRYNTTANFKELFRQNNFKSNQTIVRITLCGLRSRLAPVSPQLSHLSLYQIINPILLFLMVERTEAHPQGSSFQLCLSFVACHHLCFFMLLSAAELCTRHLTFQVNSIHTALHTKSALQNTEESKTKQNNNNNNNNNNNERKDPQRLKVK